MRDYRNFNDEQLLSCLREGNHTAFTEIYNRYWKRMFEIAARKINDLDEAEEIVQSIFVSLWQRKTELQVTGSLNAYLAVCIKYRVIKLLDKKRNEQKYRDSLDSRMLTDASTEDWLSFLELKDKLAELVAVLPDKCQLVYKMSRERGMPQKEIATTLNIAEKTVEAHLGKALKTLKAGLNHFLTTLL
ncbi:RNA polymerase [Pedobacter kyungheensis]|uniref:RNA polymerase sigma-70 factor, ECF subfamily n=2 Tax=Pedobacter TaxID=84567 RepID=A0A1G6RZN6_9SPHI|nr:MULTISPECIES: RNA polymerase sigma-70 factor [Pedobacter]KIA96510.1 RNA polymerase [Pedobacter kyungheensis]SDD09397.1 RNA polymerase sigma-70 factor, ECF subfamily [Pedobacter soli]